MKGCSTMAETPLYSHNFLSQFQHKDMSNSHVVQNERDRIQWFFFPFTRRSWWPQTADIPRSQYRGEIDLSNELFFPTRWDCLLRIILPYNLRRAIINTDLEHFRLVIIVDVLSRLNVFPPNPGPPHRSPKAGELSGHHRITPPDVNNPHIRPVLREE